MSELPGSLEFPDDKRAAQFAREFVAAFTQLGFQSLNKREIDLLVFYELERCGVIEPAASNYQVAHLLRTTPQKVNSLRTHAYARWNVADGEELVRRVLQRFFDAKNLRQALECSDPSRRSQGYLPVVLEHPVERSEFEHAVKEVNSIVIYERNREVIQVRFSALLDVARRVQLAVADDDIIKNVARATKKHETLSGVLTKDVRQLTLADVRDALNDSVAHSLEKSLEGGIGALVALARGIGL